MRALIRTGTKAPSTLTLDPNHPTPAPTDHPSGYLIQISSTSLTRSELTWPEPLLPLHPVPGFDLAGTILSLPLEPEPPGQGKSQRSSGFKEGDEVYALTTFTWKGNAREVSVAHGDELARKPRGLSWEEAATVPLSALSAWQALFTHGGLEAPATTGGGEEGGGEKINMNKGKRVLVTAASGGVGIWGVQLARHAGVDAVVGTCGVANVEFVRSLGADTVLNYAETNVLGWVGVDREARSFDVVLDCVGGATLTEAWKCARGGGKVISVAEPPDPKKPADGVAEGVQGVWFIVKANGAQLAEVTDLLEQGKCKAVVDSVYELEQFEEAFEKLEKGHARGKIVLKVGS